MQKVRFIIIISVAVVGLLIGGRALAFSLNKKIFGINDYRVNVNIAPLPQINNNDWKPNILTKAYCLVDVDSAKILIGKNETTKLPIASTTKIATALVVLENYKDHLAETVTITPKMVNVEETTIKLRVGEKITVENLLDGLLINSGNDAAYSLAEYFGGKPKFVEEMNQKAVQIGLENTKFQDPAGLSDEGFSTAKELAILGSYALRNDKFSQIVRTPEKTIYSTDGRIKHDLINSNRMIRPDESLYLPYAIGIKTGFTYEAGHVLVSAAQKDNHRIVAVVLNTFEDTKPASAKESKKLLEWGLANWVWR